jgi:tripartite-type tricarboxylate transporter receptor subunit TctC
MRERAGRAFLISVAVFCACFFLGQIVLAAAAKEAEYPTKPINYYISYQAGGATDIIVRALVEPAGKILGQPFVVINKPGGGALLGPVAVRAAKPDGYTLGSFASTQALIAPHTEECPYKDVNDFTYVLNYSKWIFPVIVKGDAPYKTWSEFIAWAKQNPRGAKIAIPGAKSQTPQGIAMWEVEQKEGVQFTYIATKGTPEQITGVLGGHFTMSATVLDASMLQYVKEGKLRFLAFQGKEKATGYESTPSFYELYKIEATGYVGIIGPKGLPGSITARLNDAFARAVKDPGFIKVMNQMNLPIVFVPHQQIDKEMKETFPKIGQVMKTLLSEEAKIKK